jgi:hypothetical protein
VGRRKRVERAEKRFARIMAMDVKPDFICVGGSGTLVYQTVEIFRQLAFPAVKRTIELATAAGMPTHVHSCGPEAALVKIMAEETGLTVIDPLEIPASHGNCNLKELKKAFGKKITLKGNLHTTDVMLRGSPDDVIRASRAAIDDAKEGGRFILSTGDQCGREDAFRESFRHGRDGADLRKVLRRRESRAGIPGHEQGGLTPATLPPAPSLGRKPKEGVKVRP